MDPKTLGTIVAIFLCVLLIPAAIGIIGGIVGVIGNLVGAFFNVIAAIFGAIFSLIGAIFGWLFFQHFDWHWPYDFFNWDFFAVVALALLVVALTSRKSRTGTDHTRR